MITTGQRFIIEVHDISAHDLAGARRLLEWSARWPGVRPAAHWIPCWHGRSPPPVHQRELARLLEEYQAEPVLHGLTHGLPGGWLDWLRFGEHWRSEFVRCSDSEAETQIRTGRDILEQATGRALSWFCAPRWQQSRATTDTLLGLGLTGYLLVDRVHLAGGPDLPIPALYFDAGERAWVNHLNASLQLRRARALIRLRRPLRLAVHPRDLASRLIESQLRVLVDTLLDRQWEPLALPELDAARR